MGFQYERLKANEKQSTGYIIPAASRIKPPKTSEQYEYTIEVLPLRHQGDSMMKVCLHVIAVGCLLVNKTPMLFNIALCHSSVGLINVLVYQEYITNRRYITGTRHDRLVLLYFSLRSNAKLQQ